MLEIAQLAVRLPMIPQRRAARLDRLAEHRLDGVDQLFGALVRPARACRDGRGYAPGREACAVQCLADVDVAEAGHHLLVRQRRLEARLLAVAARCEQRGVERVAERLGAD